MVAHRLRDVAEAAVVGRTHPVYGEEPVMFVTATPGNDIDIDQLREHLEVALAKYKRPVEITVLHELPKNAVGKIDKPALRRLVTTVRA